MRLGVWVVMALGCELVGACSGGYPLPPTRCDDFCDATKGLECEQYYEPASCVSNCEEAHTDVAACSTEFDAVVTCYRTTPNAVSAQCDFSSAPGYVRPCEAQAAVLGDCVRNHNFGRGPSF